MSATNTVAIVSEQINDEYEWIYYNPKLKIVHSVKDDYYQMESILKACNAPDTKHVDDWFRNQSTIELLNEISRDQEFTESHKPCENRENLPNGLRGWYCHRSLVNAVAMWASPSYEWYIYRLLNEVFAFFA